MALYVKEESGEYRLAKTPEIYEAARRRAQTRFNNARVISTSQNAIEEVEHLMRPLEREIFYVLYLNARHAIVSQGTLATGTVNLNTIYPRELVKEALKHNASAVVVAHNHPSGSLKPSKQDRDLTKMLYEVCHNVQIQLLDHLIVGAGPSFSFADNGIIGEIKSEIPGQGGV